MFCIVMFQVHTFLRACGNFLNGDATCTCAMAVQSGDDVFVFDRCGAQRDSTVTGAINVKAYINGVLTKGTRVLKFDSGNKYEVIKSFPIHPN